MTNHQDKELSSDSKELFQQWCNDHPEYRFWNSTDIAESAWIAGRKSALSASPQLPVAEQPAGQAVAGWKLVPIEPTQDMLCAGHAMSNELYNTSEGDDPLMGHIYRAMIAAAPSQGAKNE